MRWLSVRNNPLGCTVLTSGPTVVTWSPPLCHLITSKHPAPSRPAVTAAALKTDPHAHKPLTRSSKFHWHPGALAMPKMALSPTGNLGNGKSPSEIPIFTRRMQEEGVGFRRLFTFHQKCLVSQGKSSESAHGHPVTTRLTLSCTREFAGVGGGGL